ncbi:galactose-binding lectin l-1-like isoform X5 [Anguilla anguilla]|uniref:galactose-binding lectin l-1-like isoform X5 n=1 Tax=Anguilla anguilla TaxID=7936 RepID=UPI0015A7C90D|nr:galactose-binding lectin l-1-like isoform X5 [Anguilla anguilla]
MSLKLKIVDFKPGMELKVKGVPKPNIDRFSINVCDSKDNIALHFDVRFDYLGEHRVLVLDSRKDEIWQKPVRSENFPFQWGQEFEMTITFADDRFYINLHDGHVLQFPNHLADKQYDYICIDGEVTIKGIYVN